MALENFIQGRKPSAPPVPERQRRNARDASAPTFTSEHGPQPNSTPVERLDDSEGLRPPPVAKDPTQPHSRRAYLAPSRAVRPASVPVAA
jgi:hypothetical protein